MQPQRFMGRSDVLARLTGRLRADQIGQPLLFVGPEGAGKETTALELARLANCVDPENCRPARLCESCVKAATFQHPDIRWIGPAPASVNETVVRELLEQKRANPFYQADFAASARVSIGDPEHPGPLSIRALIHFLRLQSFQGRYKIAVVADAHRMTAGAANAFLKTLEEPPPRTLIMLLTTNADGLLPTILSRCEQVRFDPYDQQELARILAELGDLTAPEAAEQAVLADGNARKGVALLAPLARALHDWAGKLFQAIHAGQRGTAHLGADHLHGGSLPAELIPAELDAKSCQARDLAARRQRALLLCESLILYYSETLACRERGADWRPRMEAAATFVRDQARRRRTNTLLADIAGIESTKGDIDRNLNIGLSMAVLFEGLIDHAEGDQRTGAGPKGARQSAVPPAQS